jgi:uncharacterized protein (DUF169 family)
VTTLKEYNRCGEELESFLLLRTSPIAVKMIEQEQDITAEAIRPSRDRGVHLAQCQAFAMSRREQATVALLKEDNWCWAPLIGYGLVEMPEFCTGGDVYFPHFVESREAAKRLGRAFPHLEYGKYIGIVSAPLKTAGFEPDLVLIYCNPAQIRTILLAVKYKEGALVTSEFDPIDSCIFSTVPVLKTGEYRITFPDPGEYERALTAEDQVIFSVPGSKVETLMQGLTHFEEIRLGYTHLAMVMKPDFARPEFYKMLFHMWGLDEHG